MAKMPSRESISRLAKQQVKIERGIPINTPAGELGSIQVCRPRVLAGSLAVIHRRPIINVVVRLVSGEGMVEQAGSFQRQVVRVGNHPPEDGDVGQISCASRLWSN